MQSRFRRWRASPASIVAIAALVVAMAGTSVAGIATISNLNGKTVKKNSLPGNRGKKKSLPGNRIKKNSITGKQVKESSLGKVPDSSKLGGVGASGYQQAVQWILVAADGTTKLAGDSDVSIEPEAAQRSFTSTSGAAWRTG